MTKKTPTKKRTQKRRYKLVLSKVEKTFEILDTRSDILIVKCYGWGLGFAIQNALNNGKLKPDEESVKP